MLTSKTARRSVSGSQPRLKILHPIPADDGLEVDFGIDIEDEAAVEVAFDFADALDPDDHFAVDAEEVFGVEDVVELVEGVVHEVLLIFVGAKKGEAAIGEEVGNFIYFDVHDLLADFYQKAFGIVTLRENFDYHLCLTAD